MNISNDEWERHKRFDAEQYKQYGLKLLELEKIIRGINPGPMIASKTRDLLGRQVDLLHSKIRFLETEIIKLKKQLGMKDGK